MDTSQWLISLNLSQYIQVLRSNGFEDESTIRTLTDADLIHCGIDNLGHRRKMLTSLVALSSVQVDKAGGGVRTTTADTRASSCSCSCKPNICGWITIALLLIGWLVGIILLAEGATTNCDTYYSL